MTRPLSLLSIAALVALAPSLALAEDGGRGPAGGAFMSSYSTPPTRERAQPLGAPPSAFTVQSDVQEAAPPRRQQRRARAAR